MEQKRSEVLIPELRYGARVYTDIRAGEPVRSSDGVFRVPFFSAKSFLWNLLELHPDFSMIHFTVADSIPAGDIDGQIIAGLIDRGHATKTPYSYRKPWTKEPMPVLLASGALKIFLEDSPN